MTRPDPSSPLTYDEALRIARDKAQNPDTLIPYTHQRLENARYGRGFAFLQTFRSDRGDTEGYALVTATGHGSGILSANQHIDTVIAEHLARFDHANRDIPDSDLSAAHRVALAAFDAGLTRIDEAPERAAIDAETADYAEFVLLILWRSRNPGDSGRKILARNDFLLQDPDPGRRHTHPCPHCGRPAAYNARYPRVVCDHCQSRTTDHAGRRVTGHNTHLSGGMIAYYTDTLENSDGSPQEECVEVTRNGVCFIDGQPATMAEAHFGGIVVQMASAD